MLKLAHMKKLIFAAIAINVVSILLAFSITAQGQAEGHRSQLLLRCSPPMGSHLQEVQIFSQEGLVYLRELNMYGSMSKPLRIITKAWEQKKIRWISPGDGSIQLSLVVINGMKTWSYLASKFENRIIGNCEPTDAPY
jgi:hypothetical protein